LWNLKTNFKEKEIPVEFDDWLKMFQLDKTRFKGRYDAVIVDEAQDVTPRDLAIVHNIPGQKIFVGDDFQQLYAWRGSVNSFEELGINDELFLTQSFRFGEAIAEKANDVLALLQHDTPKIVGYANQHSTVSFSGSPQEKHTILCRTNTGLLANTLTSIRNGKLVHVVGNLMESINLLESAYYLSIGRNHLVKHPTMTLISDWNVLVELAQHDTDLKVLIKQVEEYKGAIPSICEELRMAGDVPPHRADIIVSTVHKAKGMEWDTVKLHDDFPELVYFSRKDRCYKVKKAEVYCLYVAITRARKQLYANPIMTQVKGWQDVLI
jgi:superfamily I DNA/RNA helicase